MKARFYDARLTRFLTRDPIGLAGGTNPYLYANANPLFFIDPFGLESRRGSQFLNVFQTGLDAAGFIPGAGAVPDALNSGISLVRGNYVDAGLSAIAAVPLIGDILGGGTKIGRAVTHVVDDLPAAKSGETLPSTLYHYTRTENVETILNNGLQPGRNGQLFTTPAGNLSSVQAQIELALPPNRGYPSALFEIDTARLQQIGINPAVGPQRIMSTPTAGGGGVEIISFP
jgi:hypothetical protein